MKVLLANKFYYRRGGDCVCTLNLEQLLKDHNHDTAVFAMQHPENFPTPWSKYFPSEIRFSPGPNILETFRRPFGSKEVKRKFNALLDDFQPDVVHLNNIHTQLSPLIAELAHRRGIKVVSRPETAMSPVRLPAQRGNDLRSMFHGQTQGIGEQMHEKLVAGEYIGV